MNVGEKQEALFLNKNEDVCHEAPYWLIGVHPCSFCLQQEESN
jgi:hypothetical protein